MADLSIFGALNTGVLGIYTHKLAMSVVAHNIANANTEGFSRQRPVIVPTSPVPISTLTQPSIPLQIGTGSMVKRIERIRNRFLDIQFRQLNSRDGYLDRLFHNLHFIEQLFNEPGENGIRYLYDSLWASLEEVMNDPLNVAAKREVVARAVQLTDNVVDLYDRLQQLRMDLNGELEKKVERINTILERLADINMKIRTTLVIRSQPNDLLDERDRLLDELSNYANVSFRDRDDGQIDLRIGDQVVLFGSVVNKLRVEERPNSKGIYDIFVGSSKVSIGDGELRAILDLRDEVIPKYMKDLDEFVLFLTDKWNLIHGEAYDASGTTTRIPFFQEMNAMVDVDDPRVFRILGANMLENGRIIYSTGRADYTDSNPANVHPALNGILSYFDGSNFGETDIVSSDSLQDIMNKFNSDPSSPATLEYAQYGSNYRIYFKAKNGEDLKDTLLIDVSNSVLKDLGFRTKTLKVWKMDEESLEKFKSNFDQSKTYHIFGTNLIIDPNASVHDILQSIQSDLNSSSSLVGARAFDMDGDGNYDVLYIIPRDDYDYDIMKVDPQDQDGFFVDTGTEIADMTVLDTENPTLDNVMGLDDTDPNDQTILQNGFDITINATTIHVDPVKDTLRNVVNRINDLKPGITADLTPHNALVFRASRDYNFDIRIMNIDGPREFWEKVGFISETAGHDWTNYTLVDRSWDFNTFKSNVDRALRLEIDKNDADYGLGITYQFEVSNTLRIRPETLAVDLGEAVDTDGDWVVDRIDPLGSTNTDAIKELSDSRFEEILSNGRESFTTFLGSIVAELGVEGETTRKLKENNSIMKMHIDNERERIKGVSLDEEMTNMIKFQQAFNASARIITAVDEMISRIIDRLGVVGR